MPTTVLRTVPRLATDDGEKIGRRAPGRTTNALSGREREYLTPGEVDRLVKTARSHGRYGQRDGLAILMCFRHGLRASELCGLRWSQIDFTTQRLTVHRRKGSLDSTHPIAGDELRELRKLARTQETGTRFLFMTERGAPATIAWLQRLLSRSGPGAGSPWCIRICCAMRPALRSPTRAERSARSRITWGIETSRIQSAIPGSRHRASMRSGD